MRRVFFSNLLFVVLLNLLVKPLWVLGIDRGVQNLLGRETYGLYFALFNLSYMLNILIDMGVTYYNSRAVSGNPSLLRNMFAEAVVLKLLLSAVYLIGSVCVAVLWGIRETALVWLLVLCFNQIVQSFTIYLRSNLSALQHYRLDSVVSVADKVLMIALFGFLLWTPFFRNDFTLNWFVYGQSLCLVATLALAVWLNMRHAGKINWNVDTSTLRHVWSRAYPYAVLVLFMSVYAKADGVMLERMVSATEAGVYASGYRLFDATNQFGYLFAMLLMPIFSRMLASNEKVQSLAESGFAALFIFTVTAASASLIYRNELMHLLYREADAYGANVFAVIMCSLPGSALVYVYGTLLAANANLKQLNVITAAGAIVNLGLNAWLIPAHGALGAAGVSVVTHTLVGLLEIAACARLLGFHRDLRFVARLVAFGALSLLVFYLSRAWVLTWELGIVAGGVLSGALAVGTRLVRPQQMLSLVRLRGAR